MISEWMRERRLLGCQQHSWYVACVTQSTRYSQLHITMLCHSLPKKKEHVRHHQVLCAAVRFAYTRTASNSKRYLPESSKRIKENILAYIYIPPQFSPICTLTIQNSIWLIMVFLLYIYFLFFSCSHTFSLSIFWFFNLSCLDIRRKRKKSVSSTQYTYEKKIYWQK